MNPKARDIRSAMGPSRPRTGNTRRISVAVAAILVLGLVVATIASVAVSRANVSERREVLDAQGAAITAAFDQRIDDAVAVLQTARGLFTIDPDPSNERFQAFLGSATMTTPDDDGTLRYDGFRDITFIQWVRPAETEAFIDAKGREGLGGSFDGISRGTDSYVFALHTSPESGTLGLDVRPIETRRTALHRARDTGEPAMTEWVLPVTATGVDPARADQAVVVYLPVYSTADVPDSVAERRAALVGWMNTGIRASELFSEAIPESSRGYDVALYDGAPSARTLVRSTDASVAAPASLSARYRLTVGESTWNLVITGRQAVSAAVATTRSPVAVFLVVLLLACLTAVLVAVLGRQRRRIQQQVIEITGQLQQSEHRLRRMAETLPVGIFDADLVSGEAFVNQAFRDKIGGDWSTWALAADNQLLEEISDRVRSHEVFSTRVNTSHGDGEWLEIRATGICDDDGNMTRVLGSIRDVTSDVTLEARLSEARDAALANARMKSEFLANMSHEIRTPLNSVIGLATLMLDDELPPAQQERLVTLRQAGQNLLILLNDILDVSKLEAGRVHLEEVPFSVETVIEQVTSVHASTAYDRGLTLQSAVEPEIGPVIGDPGRLRQVLQNLVGNALKFTETGLVEITAVLVDRDEEHRVIRVAVRDTGIGISAEAQRDIFEAFAQADASTTRRYGGTGLGLAICRQILDLMGTALELESTPGQGSTFSFTVRLAVADQAVESHAQPQDPNVADPADRSGIPRSGATLLLVEDNEANRQVALGMLARLGYSAEFAVDGAEALDALRLARYDAVLMDCQMPRLDGYETTARVRATEGDGERIPIIALTASAMVGDRERCIAAGMDDYLAKPIDLDELADAIERALGGRRGADGPTRGTDAASSASDRNDDTDRPEPSRGTTPLLDPEAVAKLQELPSTDGSMFDDVSTIFLRTSAKEIEDARAAADAEDWDQLAYLIHQLGGSASIIGATNLTNRCRDLKIRIDDGPASERIDSGLRDVEAELTRLRAVLGRQTSERPATGDAKQPSARRH